ncbi:MULTISPECIES: hypothetical protein [Streptomyces]|uniref:hypothetical protein n=1 Tax=Streptomyces TaxID=1883 RepID=UPI000CF1F049|nr:MULTISPECIES: hypothetical protein [Streptomyces]PPS72605.1 hypothetical protein BV882_18495 [Streptomyces sp. 46]
MSAVQLAALARTSEPQSVLRRFLALDAAVTVTRLGVFTVPAALLLSVLALWTSLTLIGG